MVLNGISWCNSWHRKLQYLIPYQVLFLMIPTVSQMIRLLCMYTKRIFSKSKYFSKKRHFIFYTAFSGWEANIINLLIFLFKMVIFKIKSKILCKFKLTKRTWQFGGGRVVTISGRSWNQGAWEVPGFILLSLRWKELKNKEKSCN